MPQSLSNTIIHSIFSTKHRVKLIDEEIEHQLFGFIGNECNKLNCKTIKVSGYLDHVHILCKLHRPVSQSDLIKTVKAHSSKWMKQQGQKYEQFYWQDGFSVFSVGKSELPRIIKYLENQKEHHKSKTFKEEYLDFLEYYGVEYELKYLWD
jgi:REP element-mobilizing transposase RayT